MRFCGRECQKACRKQHKLDCADLAANRLPTPVRVVRFIDGAVIVNPEAMVPSEHCYEARVARRKQGVVAFVVGAWLSKPETCALGLLATQPQLLQMVAESVAQPLRGCRGTCGQTISEEHVEDFKLQRGRSGALTGYPPGTKVTISGIVSQPELNGQMAVVESVNRSKARYSVHLKDGRQLNLKMVSCGVKCPCIEDKIPCGSDVSYCSTQCCRIVSP